MSEATKKKLQQRLQEALQELEQLDKRLEHKADYGPGKGDPAIYEWELSLALRQQAQARVETIRQALHKLEDGLYGTCERCGAPIDPERLEILPSTTLCIKCARTARS